MSNIFVSFWNHLSSKRLKKVCLPYLSHETKYPSFMSGQLCMLSYSVIPDGSENFSILVSLLVTGQCLHSFQHCPLGVPWRRPTYLASGVLWHQNSILQVFFNLTLFSLTKHELLNLKWFITTKHEPCR